MGNLLDVKSNLVPNLKKLYNIFMYASLVLAIVALAFYMTNGKTQYNSQKLAPIIIVMIIIAAVLYLVSIFFDIRYLKYGASVALLMAFLQFAITEINFFSNWIIATDPVADNVLTYYLTVAIVLLVSTVLSFVSAVMSKGAYYKQENKEAE